jgi:hypothetical protein
VGARGFADVRRIGVRRKREVFAALFSFEGVLHVAVPPHRFIWPGPYIATRRTAPLLVLATFPDGHRLHLPKACIYAWEARASGQDVTSAEFQQQLQLIKNQC